MKKPVKYFILYVEDDPDDVLLMKEAFEGWPDYDILTAKDGLTALEILARLSVSRQSLPALIIMDINLPLMDGRETLKRIKSMDSLKDIPVVLFSTSLSPADKDLADEHQAICILKPRGYTEVHQLAARFTQYCRPRS